MRACRVCDTYFMFKIPLSCYYGIVPVRTHYRDDYGVNKVKQ